MLEVLLLSRGGGPARHVDRDARALVLRPCRRHGGVPGPRARRRPRLLGAARRVRRGARVRVRRRAPRAPPARGLRQPDGARARRGAGRRRGARERRLPLRRQRRLAALRQPAADRHARSRARGRWPARPPSRRRSCSGRAGSRAASTRPRRARWACARSCPTRCCSCSSRSRSSPRSPRSARCSRPRCSSCPPPRCASGRSACRSGSSASVALAAAQGIAGLWLSVELNTPPGTDDRRARRRALRRVARLAIEPRPIARRRAALAGAAALLALVARRLRRELGPTALGPEGRRDDDADRRLDARGRRRRGARAPDPAAQHRPARLRAAAGRRRGGRGREARVPERRRARRLDGHRDLERRRLAGASSTSARRCPCACRARARGPRPRATTRTGGTTRATPRRPCARSATRSSPPIPPRRASYRANAAAYLRRLRALDAGIRTCLARVPPAQRKLVSDHDAFGYFAHRYGITVVGAVIPSQTTQAQASAADIADARARDPPRARARGLPGELAQREAGAADRARDRRAGRLHALRRHARPERLAPARPTSRWSGPTPTP